MGRDGQAAPAALDCLPKDKGSWLGGATKGAKSGVVSRRIAQQAMAETLRQKAKRAAWQQPVFG